MYPLQAGPTVTISPSLPLGRRQFRLEPQDARLVVGAEPVPGRLPRRGQLLGEGYYIQGGPSARIVGWVDFDL